jgi:hypothetical protein
LKRTFTEVAAEELVSKRARQDEDLNNDGNKGTKKRMKKVQESHE